MDNALRTVIEMNEFVWQHLREDLKGFSSDEVNWRPLPYANSINLIVRHLRIEAQWKLASLQLGEAEPIEATPSVKAFVDSVGFNYETNLDKLDELCTRFIGVLREMDEATLLKRNEEAHGKHSPAPHFLSFHHPTHMCMHWGQIRTIRVLYRKSRGESIPAQFFPENLSFP
ncbi:MAG: DinB family protein [Candidatus Sumerlaeaceae bacterium]